jgi:hypothetical protein
MTIDSQRLRTAAAAAYLSARGRQTSPSLLRKLRLRGVDDPGERGPPWERAPNGDCLYPVSALEQYLAAYNARLVPMAPAEPPEHLLRAKRPEAA